MTSLLTKIGGHTIREMANAVRALSMDAVQAANSGHPGMPLGMADIATVLWTSFLSHCPHQPTWPNRDRFVLSNGHGSMLLYALLHLTGYDLPLAELKRFRQKHAATPGHPEWGETPGVETTTGPLGQGLANAVGMAVAEKKLAHTFNRPTFPLIDHFTYAFVGDGCLMEGISHEVASLAGVLGLGKLIVFWDANSISIDGKITGWCKDDTPARFRAYGWHVIADIDGHDPAQLNTAITQARSNKQQPSLLCCRTIIGFGSPAVGGSHKSHGTPLGEAEVRATKAALGWPHGPFDIPASLYHAWNAHTRGENTYRDWHALRAKYTLAHPQLAATFTRQMAGTLPDNWTQITTQWLTALRTAPDLKPVATRKSSLQCLEKLAPLLPELLGGSADLSASNCTLWSGATPLQSDTFSSGNYLHYGVREFGMFAMMNGMALHGGLLPYGGTFLVFSDYGRNAIRLAALMRQRVIFVLSHDSIGLGEDGPTHQPIEHAASLRLIPQLAVWRPCDAMETAIAWQSAIEHHGPSCLLLTRQAVPQYPRHPISLATLKRGGYILFDPPLPEGKTQPDALIIATGSEVTLAMQAATQGMQENKHIRVVSMPCVEVFSAQPKSYQDHVLPATITARVAVEAGSTGLWYQYVGEHGRILGIDRFGVSAPIADAYEDCNMTLTHLLAQIEACLHPASPISEPPLTEKTT